MGLSDHNCIILRTNKIRCALNKEIHNLLNEEVLLEYAVVELVYKFDDKSTSWKVSKMSCGISHATSMIRDFSHYNRACSVNCGYYHDIWGFISQFVP